MHGTSLHFLGFSFLFSKSWYPEELVYLQAHFLFPQHHTYAHTHTHIYTYGGWSKAHGVLIANAVHVFFGNPHGPSRKFFRLREREFFIRESSKDWAKVKVHFEGSGPCGRESLAKSCPKNRLINNNLSWEGDSVMLAACLQGYDEVIRDNLVWFGRCGMNPKRSCCSTWVLRQINMEFAKDSREIIFYSRKIIFYSRRMAVPG